MKYSIQEFAQEIRKLYPAEYKEQSDQELIDIWLKKYPDDKEKIEITVMSPIQIKEKKKIKKYWYVIGVIVLIGISSYLYRLYNYPKNEDSLVKLYCGKFWKPTKIKVEDLYIDGKRIKESSGPMESISNASVGYDPKNILDNLQKRLDDIRENDFFIVQQNPTNKQFWMYDQSFDKSVNAYTYTINKPVLNFKSLSSCFELGVGTIQSFFVENGNVADSIYVKYYSYTVNSINEREVSIDVNLILIVEGKECKIITTNTYSPIIPQSMERYQSEFSSWGLNNNIELSY